MTKKLLLTYIFIIAIVCLIIGYTSISTSQKYLENQIRNGFIKDINLLSDILQNQFESDKLLEFTKHYSNLMGFRITLINLDGSIIADSDVDNLQNHSKRTEFQQALQNNLGFSIRYSETLGTNYLYYAKKINYNSTNLVLRISSPLLDLRNLKTDILNLSMGGIILGLIVSIVVATLFSNIFSTAIKQLTLAVEDVSKGNYDKKIDINSNDEIGKLADAFNLMARELKYTVLQLKDRNIKLESILNSINSGLIAIDADYNIMLLNHLSYKFLGINDGNLINRNFYEVVQNKSVLNLLNKSTVNNEYAVEEINHNNLKILRISANPIINTDSKGIGTVLLIEDITQIKKLEQIRSEFVSNVTHELKTPLTSIKGFVDTLKNGAIEDFDIAKHFLDIIDIEAERLYKLIQEILTLSEIETRDKDINMAEIQIDILINSVKKILQPLADKKGIKLEFVVESGMINLFCNKDRIIQLLINLIENSIKYTEQGCVKAEFKNNSNILVITIEDTGIGIPEQSIPRIFERFYRVDKGRSRKAGGTGLGLSIVKHIVILYNGKIEVQSKLGEGSIFKVDLPILAVK